jgi:Transposase DDE domain
MGREVAIDATDVAAWSNGQRFLYHGGPERKTFSDPDASWGHRSAVSTRKGGGFFGYRVHAAVCAATGLPLAWQVETARDHESRFVAPLLDALHARGFRPQTCAMDMGYDNNRVYAECDERDCAAIVPLRRNQGERNCRIPRGSDRWRSLYRRRSAVEREFGFLKHHFGLAAIRVRGIERVRLHADLIMLARLGQALVRARAVPLASA